MKRILCLLLCACLLLGGCAASQGMREPVTFYYLRTDYRYGTADGVIAGESRESSGHSGDLTYLISMYLMGPSSEELVSPLPQGTTLLDIIQEENTVTLALSDVGKSVTELEYSLACACLAMTVMGISGGDSVTIQSGDRSVTITGDNLTIYDSSTAVPTEAIK